MQIEILRDRRIFVYFHLNKGGNGIRSPPDLKFELKIKFQIQEDKTVKYASKKVFILENGKYKEITYSKLQELEQSDKSYAEKFFLLLYGMLMKVTAETYKAYYKDKRRQKYIDERSLLNGDVSYDALDTDETLGAEVFADTKTNVEATVINKMTVAELRKAFLLLSPDERELMTAIYIQNLTEREYAKQKGVYHNAVHKRKLRILEKLKKFLDGKICDYVSRRKICARGACTNYMVSQYNFNG